MALDPSGSPAGRLSEADLFWLWLAALEARHLAHRSFGEVRRSLQALSSLYVERQSRLGSGRALNGAGKRAAFALFYGPLHFLLAREVVRALGSARPAPLRILDLGCGTGAGGAAWALEAGGSPAILGVDRNGWAVQEARWTFRRFGLNGQARRQSLETAPLAGRGGAILAAFTVNELAPPLRQRLLERILAAAQRGARLLVIEPVAKRLTPWWEDWSAAFIAAGGRDDIWRFPANLPEGLRRLDRAAGLDHRELAARTLWLGALDRSTAALRLPLKARSRDH